MPAESRNHFHLMTQPISSLRENEFQVIEVPPFFLRSIFDVVFVSIFRILRGGRSSGRVNRGPPTTQILSPSTFLADARAPKFSFVQ